MANRIKICRIEGQLRREFIETTQDEPTMAQDPCAPINGRQFRDIPAPGTFLSQTQPETRDLPRPSERKL